MREMKAHVKAPRTPAVVAITLMRPRSEGAIWSWVLAYRTAVPETVAIASESRNQAARKRTMSFKRRASLIVLHSDAHE